MLKISRLLTSLQRKVTQQLSVLIILHANLIATQLLLLLLES